MDDLIRKVEDGFLFWCPGCNEPHMVWVDKNNPLTGARWTWNGDMKLPTFSPSINVTVDQVGNVTKRCHFFVRSGQISYCSDSFHSLAGKEVPMVSFGQSLG